MDPTSWSAYSQHFSRLGASMNHPPGALSQQAQMNDLALSSSLPRQEHIPGYGNAGGPHHFLLAASHSLNPSQTNHNDPSFNANLFAANYDASLFSTSFPSANKNHLSSFPQGAAGLFKAVNRENDFNDLRTGFSHCGMSAYARNSDGNNGLPSGSGLSSGHLFPNSMPPSSWRHSGIIPPSCGPFGVLPHETVLQRSHLVARGSEKLNVQPSKQSRTSLQSTSFVEQDLSRGYRTILSSPARPPSSYVDSSNTSHSSLLSPQSDPYFSSVSDNYYSSCSKNDFAAYSSYCSNVQPAVQRSSISPYCYSQTFGNFEPSIEKQEVPTTSTNTSANTSFSNFVPNSNLSGNPTHLHNGQISRQSVITSNISNNSVMYNSESHQPNHPYNIRETYPYPSGSSHAASCVPSHSNSNSNGNNTGRQAMVHMSNSHHSSTGQALYPPMSTPIPASTPAHATPPSSMGQAYVPTPLPLSHDSGCSSVNSQSVMYHSPSNDGCYSTPGTCHSESGSPAKQDMSQHSSPSVYSIESSNLSMNSAPFVENHHVRSQSNSEGTYGGNNMMNGGLSSEMQDNTNDSSKMIDENLQDVNPSLMATSCSSQQKDLHLTSMLPIDMVKLNKDSSYQNAPVESNFQTSTNLSVTNDTNEKVGDPLLARSECNINTKSDVFAFSSDSPPPALDFTPKGKMKCKRGRKRKCDLVTNALPLNCTYSHLQNSQQALASPKTPVDAEVSKALPCNKPDNEFDNATLRNNLPIPANSSPVPVDLSHVSMNLSVKKPESPEPKDEVKDDVEDLSYETEPTSTGKWTLVKMDAEENESKIQSTDEVKNVEGTEEEVKKINKCASPVCRTPPMDDLSDESKKLCNSIEEDLGFLAGLSSDPDVEDSASKGSFTDKKSKKEQGFLQSFLTFLEGSNEPVVHSDPVNLESKNQKQESSVDPAKEEESGKKCEVLADRVDESDNNKSNLIEEHDDKDNFDEAPSLDPSLFGCSTLQKEMVVPNPEAPSFSSDEDENSTQGIFDSVAMAIQRLCEDNEDDHNEKGSKSVSSNKNTNNKEDIPSLTSMKEASENNENVTVETDLPKEDKVEECTIKSACVVKTKRGKRRRTRHLLVIKVKRTAEKSPAVPKNLKTGSLNPKRTRNSAKEVQIIKTVQNSQRRTLMRKCKERGLRKRNSGSTKRKPRNCVKRKYVYEEVEEAATVASAGKEAEVSKEVTVSEQKEDTTVVESVSTPSQEVIPKKTKKIYKSRPRRKRRGCHKKSVSAAAKPAVEPEAPKTTDEVVSNLCLNESFEINAKQKSVNNNEHCWSNETHFKTGDFIVSIDNKNNENPPIWRIEGKNVLQLFEALEDGENNNLLYHNTSSYSRWSPSSKHKYSKQPVKVIKADDDTVIVELLKNTDNIDDKESSGSCDYTIHPQRENFEVYLQTLVSHALDPDFIPEIIKENDEYFLSHLKAIEEITSEKKGNLLQCDKWSSQLLNTVRMYPYVSVSMSKEDEKSLCQVCNCSKIQYTVHFHGQIYDSMTLESKAEGQSHPVCDFNFPLCGSCVQTVTLYSRLHHHKYHFFQLGCKKVKDVKKGEDKDSHAILEECLQDAEWMTQMFQDMLEMWNACDKYR